MFKIFIVNVKDKLFWKLLLAQMTKCLDDNMEFLVLCGVPLLFIIKFLKK